MTGDGAPRNGGLATAQLLEALRDDVREDLAATEGRLMAVLHEANRRMGSFVTEHRLSHAAEADERKAAHARFESFIDASKLAEARRDGALGAARYVLDLLGRNWKALVAIVVAILAATGTVHIDVAAR